MSDKTNESVPLYLQKSELLLSREWKISLENRDLKADDNLWIFSEVK